MNPENKSVVKELLRGFGSKIDEKKNCDQKDGMNVVILELNTGNKKDIEFKNQSNFDNSFSIKEGIQKFLTGLKIESSHYKKNVNESDIEPKHSFLKKAIKTYLDGLDRQSSGPKIKVTHFDEKDKSSDCQETNNQSSAIRESLKSEDKFDLNLSEYSEKDDQTYSEIESIEDEKESLESDIKPKDSFLEKAIKTYLDGLDDQPSESKIKVTNFNEFDLKEESTDNPESMIIAESPKSKDKFYLNSNECMDPKKVDKMNTKIDSIIATSKLDKKILSIILENFEEHKFETKEMSNLEDMSKLQIDPKPFDYVSLITGTSKSNVENESVKIPKVEENLNMVRNEKENSSSEILVILIKNSNDFDNLVSNGLSLLHYSATWCQPSKLIDPLIRDMARHNPAIKFVDIDIDEAKRFLPDKVAHIQSVPYFEIFHNGEKLYEFMGDNIVKIKKSIKILNEKQSNKN